MQGILWAGRSLEPKIHITFGTFRRKSSPHTNVPTYVCINMSCTHTRYLLSDHLIISHTSANKLALARNGMNYSKVHVDGNTLATHCVGGLVAAL